METDRDRGIYRLGFYSELAGSPLVSVKINGLGNVLEHSKLYCLTALGNLKSCRGEHSVSHGGTLT